MKSKFTILEFIVLIVVLSVFMLFLSPKVFNSQEDLKKASVRANVSMAVSSVKSIFALKDETSMTKIADIVTETLNKTSKNPFNKNIEAYKVNSVSKGSVVFVADDKNDFITIKGYADSIEAPILMEVIYKNK